MVVTCFPIIFPDLVLHFLHVYITASLWEACTAPGRSEKEAEEIEEGEGEESLLKFVDSICVCAHASLFASLSGALSISLSIPLGRPEMVKWRLFSFLPFDLWREKEERGKDEEEEEEGEEEEKDLPMPFISLLWCLSLIVFVFLSLSPSRSWSLSPRKLYSGERLEREG